MKILITGAGGFIGKNLTAYLNAQKNGNEVYEYSRDCSAEKLNSFCSDCDFVFNLAGVNRPENEGEFIEGNCGFLSELLSVLEKHGNRCPIMLSSSIQAELDNPYGRSKKAAEEILLAYSKKTGANVLIYRFPNVFGKWTRPFYNSVVATFCHSIARSQSIRIDDPEKTLELVYIDDVVEGLSALLCEERKSGFLNISPLYRVTLRELAEKLYCFANLNKQKMLPNISDGFEKKLYATYASYLPENSIAVGLDMHCDERGSFTELFRTQERGQFSVNITKPGVKKGGHWHMTKTEIFIVVSGEGLITLTPLDGKKTYDYRVSGTSQQAVSIPCGYVHSIENVGESDLVTVMWANECYDPQKPDTYIQEI